MDSSFFFTILVATIGFYVLYRKFRSRPEKKETESPSLVPPSSLSLSPVPPSSLPPSSGPPSSLSHNWTHDVFASFRGEDVRRDFLAHIMKEFQRMGITPFDDNGITRGESIGPELIQAIRGSKIAIILLSRNYASSKWCLDELVEIMKCRQEFGQTVITIFYKVDPSDVKKLTGDFGKVFQKTCAGKTTENTERWRGALKQVATIAGYDSSNWDNEAAMVEKIATDISKKLISYAPSSDSDGLVGMKAHMDKMEPFLLLGSPEVRMIGIWGPSGIGKSTIARVLFINIAHQFDFSVFMENIKTRCPRPCRDEYSAKLQLQKEFLSLIINHNDIRIPHLGVVQDRLKGKKVLVVLDDIDHLLQLDAIAKETRWFGPGSRIIITTQDKEVLNAHRINHIYKVDFPSADKALQMFCMSAFGQNFPHDGFENLAWEVTKLAGGLPLGLKVIGSHFRGKHKHEWKNLLPSLRTRLDGEIESILRFSYDVLCDEDKDLFLYIACFFNNERIEKVEEHLATIFVDVKRGLQVLAEKSLISFNFKCITMHDLLARLGKEIVRRPSIFEPGQRQFLCDTGDICEVLNDDALGSRNVTCIDFNYSEIEDELNINERAFERMTNLQFIKALRNDKISKHAIRVNNLPRQLRLLHWEYFPMTCLPSNFNPKFLVELNMPYSKLEKLWEGVQKPINLKWVDLHESKNLKELPDISNAIKLEELNLEGCSSLVKLSSSIGDLINLQKLNLKGCSSLVELPFSLGNVINLEYLLLSNCSSLLELPSSIGNFANLQELDLRDCSSLVELPSSIGNLINLAELELSGCSGLVGLPSSIGNLQKLLCLKLQGCSSLVEIPCSIGNFINLQKLDLIGCSSLGGLPSSIGNLKKLFKFYLQGCAKLESIPIDIDMESLIELDLTDCSSLKTFPEISTNIRVLWLNGTAIEEFPSSIRSGKCPHAFKCITELHLSGTKIQEVAPWVKELPHLYTLVVKGCTKLVSLPQLPNSLKFLDAENCESLERLDPSFHSAEFDSLTFANCFKLNQEARELVQKSTCTNALLPGEKVPNYFSYRANGSSLSMKLYGFGTHLPISLKFKACVLPVVKGTLEVNDWEMMAVSYRITEKQNGVDVTWRSKDIYFPWPFLKEHLYMFEFEEEVSSSELVFEFEFNSESLEIGECGIRTSFV